MQRFFLLSILMLISAHFYGQVKSGPSQQETADWIVDKLTSDSRAYDISSEFKDDATAAYITNFLKPHFSVSNDSLNFEYYELFSDFDKRGNFLRNTAQNYFVYQVAIKDIQDVGVITKKFARGVLDPPGGADSLDVYFLRIFNTASRSILPGNESVPFMTGNRPLDIPIDLTKEKDLATRLTKAFAHLESFYRVNKPKVKEVF